MEILLTIMLCHAQASFVASMYRICTIGFDPSFIGFNHGSYTPEEGMALVWIGVRSLTDTFMGIRFFIGVVRKAQYPMYADWMRYGLTTMFLDGFFAAVLYQNHKYAGLEMLFVTIDAMIKLVIIGVVNYLRKLATPIAQMEKRPLLV